MMKRMLALLLIFLMLMPAAQAAEIPQLLKFSQKATSREYVRDEVCVQSTYPTTRNETVNQEMRALIDQMTAEGRNHLPTGKIDLMPAYLDVGATVFRTGSK